MTIWRAGFWPNHRISLLHADGRSVAMTEEGRWAMRGFGSLSRDKNAPRLLAAGGSYRYTTPDLTRVYRLTPGRYRLTVTYDERIMKDRYRVKSDQIALRIDP